VEPWYKVASLRREVREGRSFNPDEFAIALEQVVAGTAPEDYRDPVQFFSRTCFTRALKEHLSIVLKRLGGQTSGAAPVLSLITQFGGGKTHTLAALYHLVNASGKTDDLPGVKEFMDEMTLTSIPDARVAVFVGNAWDPRKGRETPWIDVARQLAGNKGVEALGKTAVESAPGTETLADVFKAANGPVLVLFDEVLNFMNRHRGMADQFFAFLQNLTVAMTGTTNGAAVISLPRSQVEMTEWDFSWQDKINKMVGRVAKDLISNDEAEISEVVRRRLFEDLGDERLRKRVAKTYADWCFERRAQLPTEWTAVDTAVTEAKAREYLMSRFESCYPFHPATLSVFQRKWRSLPQYQQTRGTLAMLAQWISMSSLDAFKRARKEPLITLGSAPLEEPDFLSVVLGQLGEPNLMTGINTDICGEQSHARALDADAQGPLREIHRRVGTCILFESSGGQVDKVAHLPELRFALGSPEVDTASIDNAAVALARQAYYIRTAGSDGFFIRQTPTATKVMNDRRASLDEDLETKPKMGELVKKEFDRGATVTIYLFPSESGDIPDNPRLGLVVMDPGSEWTGEDNVREKVREWTRQRGTSPRLYPGALVWCFKKPGNEFREKVEVWLAWRKVAKELTDGTLGDDLDRDVVADIHATVNTAESEASDEVWACYRFVVVSDPHEKGGLKVIDLGAGHSSSGETLCGRVLTALKNESLLNESVGAGYIERNWPPALKESGVWPLSSLRQSFLDGSLTRLVDPDVVLKIKVVEFVSAGEMGLASGQKPDGTYEIVWFGGPVSPDEVAYEPGVVLLTKAKSKELTERAGRPKPPEPPAEPPEPPTGPGPKEPVSGDETETKTCTIRVSGAVPMESWNRLSTTIIPKLRSGESCEFGISFTAIVDRAYAASLIADLRRILDDLGLSSEVSVEEESA
jgi:hypothetical protein